MNEIYKNLSLENLENEIWRDIEGYEGLYEVSNMGRVKSLIDNHNNSREKILKQGKNNKTGYLKVNLWKEGKMKSFRVHRLVANAFIDNPSNLPCINHKNEIKTDNRAENLEPCTQKYNVNYKNAQQRRVAHTDYKAVAEKKSKRVYQYTKEKELVAIWKSTNEAGRNGYNFGAVAACCRGERKHYKKCLWSYTEIN